MKAAVYTEREAMSETEADLLKRDLTKAFSEYFEPCGQAEVDVTRTQNGYSVCVLLKAARIKRMRRPQ